MPALDGIKGRIKSVEATSKITSAMKLVATAKLKKTQDAHERVNIYSKTVFNKIQQLVSSVDSKDNIFIKNNWNKKLHIIITSDLGLCGGYNNNTLKLFKNNFNNADEVIVLGNKGIASLKNLEIKPIMAVSDVGSSIDYDIIQKVVKEVLTAYGEKKNIGEVNIYYTKFINNVTFEETKLKLLPIDKIDKPIIVDYEFEPDANSVFEKVMPLYLGSVMFGKITESQLSEQASRRTAMENATDNANELIDELTIEYNRARQANITQEISEIVAGANAL